MSDFTVGDTLHFLFTTRQFSDGVPTVLSGSPVLGAFEDAVAAPITAGVTVTVSVNSVVGLNRANIVATGANGFEAGKSYGIAITTGTVGGTSVVGEVVASFSLGRAPALQPTTLGRTLDVTAAGEAGIDLDNTVGTLTNAELAFVDSNERVDVGSWLGTAVTLSGTLPDVNVEAMDANSIASGTIAAAELTNIENEIWDALKSAHVVANSFGDFLDIEVSGRLASADINLTAGVLDEVATLTGHTAQTGDSFARLGAPAAASIAADLLAIDNFVDGLETTIGVAGAGLTDITINAASVDALWDEAMTETTGAPAVTASFREALKWMFALSRNKLLQTATLTTLRNDADGGDLATSVVADDATTYTRNEWST